MLYDGQSVQLENHDGILHFIFDIKAGSANVINEGMMSDMIEALSVIEKQKNIKGLIFRSNKDHFIFGADITEFAKHFANEEKEIAAWLAKMNKVLNAYEDFSFPTVACINGFALGGGFEVCLSADYRLMDPKAKVGLPETQLGIMPGWGGTVRLSRLCGVDNAVEWICGGKQYRSADALKIAAVDGLVESGKQVEAATNLIARLHASKQQWKNRREQKKSPIRLNKMESMMSFETCRAFVGAAAGKNYPAPMKVIDVIEKGARLSREDALAIEGEAFASLAKTSVADSLISVFLGDQYLKKVSKKITKGAAKVNKAAVLGAGIMGGGIAYQSAATGTPIVMKDINQGSLDLGLSEATKILGKELARGKIDGAKMAHALNTIDPTLHYQDLVDADLIVEAVVENPKVKGAVLAEVEALIGSDTVLTSNTSTISITELAKSLKRPENFCGMHFFNPVHRMPLVEVIRGEKTSEETIARTVQYALQMKKTPIVVNDCPGFLVNRVLFPYFNGFCKLIEDGVDYQRIDKVMEKFGWPMGPAYLMDVVGIDTGDHAANIMATAFPDRMKIESETIVQVMHKNKRLGQKNGVGFYKYEMDKKGRPQKLVDEAVNALIAKVAKNKVEVSDDDIVMRMMLPMIIECARCLEEKIVSTPQEVDMGLLLGLGFPPFRAGAFKFVDTLGMDKVLASCEKFSSIGAMYHPTATMMDMGKSGKKYY